MDTMDIELWSSLPPELVERALAFLPAPVLCRFRSVCKRWNSLICTPAFGALCIQNASHEARFIVFKTRATKRVSLAENQSKVNYESWPWARDGWSYEISEVHLEKRTCSTMVEWTEAAMREVLAGPKPKKSFSTYHVKAFGCWKSIVLLCMPSGMSIVFDLRTASWESSLPCKPLQKGILSFLYGKPMNGLMLPITALWDQLHETHL